MMIWAVSTNGLEKVLRECLRNGRPSQSPSFSQDPRRMGRKSPSPSWPPHRLLRCCCDLEFQACSSGGGVGGGTVGISSRAVAVGISASGREVTGGPDTSESISTSKFHFVSSFDRFTSAPLLARRFSADCSALKQTMLRPHQVFIRRCISSPPATIDPSVRQLGCSHGVLPSGSHCESSKNKSSVPNRKWNGR